MDLNPAVLRNLVETLCSSEGQIALEKTTKSIYSYASAKDTNCAQLLQTEGIIEGLTRIIVLEEPNFSCAREYACGALRFISSCHRGSDDPYLRSLVRLDFSKNPALVVGLSNSAGREGERFKKEARQALLTIEAIAGVEGNGGSMVESEGVMGALMVWARKEGDEFTERRTLAIATIKSIAEGAGGTILKHEGMLECLVRAVMREGATHKGERRAALSALASAVTTDEVRREILAKRDLMEGITNIIRKNPRRSNMEERAAALDLLLEISSSPGPGFSGEVMRGLVSVLNNPGDASERSKASAAIKNAAGLEAETESWDDLRLKPGTGGGQAAPAGREEGDVGGLSQSFSLFDIQGEKGDKAATAFCFATNDSNAPGYRPVDVRNKSEKVQADLDFILDEALDELEDDTEEARRFLTEGTESAAVEAAVVSSSTPQDIVNDDEDIVNDDEDIVNETDDEEWVTTDDEDIDEANAEANADADANKLTATPPRVCHFCGSTGPHKLFRCSCKLVRFCNRECQTKAWRGHQKECRKVTKGAL
ncbi:hypothetical protein TrCOL_g9431 [Triparma columacea]|uniref:MYND-type domain-containing protein n=1 Tax=Triparma columacea TaxID=722753 RepID=A0A9W7L8G5_9STRA|nr:hypothetical protein TrCOL_g9431 [Triparma columacea]